MLDKNLKAFLDDFNKNPPFPPDVSPNIIRSMIGTTEEPSVKAHLVRDILIPVEGGEIPARLYIPEGKGPFPVCLFFHGGGFVGGSTLSYDAPLHAACIDSGCIILSADYRLAPENKFPACFEDCYAATKWASENAASFCGDAERLAVSGVSAGGTLAGAVAVMARDRKGPKINYQILMYPVTDMARSVPSRSRIDYAEGYYHCETNGRIFDNFLVRTEEDKIHPYLSLVLTPDLRGLPKALVMTMEYDMLRDEARVYADLMKEAGVEVEYYMAPGMTHGVFVWNSWCPASKTVVNDYFAAALKKEFYK